MIYFFIRENCLQTTYCLARQTNSKCLVLLFYKYCEIEYLYKKVYKNQTCTTAVLQDVNSEGSCMCGDRFTKTALSAQFCYEPTTVLKNKVY